MERKAEVSLHCTHSYCSECIRQWSAEHSECPMCRGNIGSEDDAWVLQETPTQVEVRIRATSRDCAAIKDGVGEWVGGGAAIDALSDLRAEMRASFVDANPSPRPCPCGCAQLAADVHKLMRHMSEREQLGGVDQRRSSQDSQDSS